MRLRLLLAAVLSLPSSARAATYHVAKGGSDGAAGTAAAPWATLQHAALRVGPGDEVLVHDGSYRGFELKTSGIESKRITFRATGAAVIDAGGPTGAGIRLTNVSFVTVEGFKVEKIDGGSKKEVGIAARGATPTSPMRGLVIRNNTVKDCSPDGVYLSEAAGALVEGNTISGARESGIYLANAGSDGAILRGNHIFGNGIAGIHHNGDASVGGDGIISALVIEGNVIHENRQNGLNMDGVQASLVQNNLIYGNGQNGIRAYAIDAAQGPAKMRFVNNTIVAGASGGWALRITEDEGGNVAFNNVLLAANPSNGSIALDGTKGFASAANVVGNRFTTDRDATILSLSEWQALGYDAGSKIAALADLFIDPAAADFRLPAASPAVDAGLASFAGQPAPSRDIAGVPRPAGTAWDIGAHERCPAAPCAAADGGAADGGTAEGGISDGRAEPAREPAGGDGAAGGPQEGAKDAGADQGPATGGEPGSGGAGCGCALGQPPLGSRSALLLVLIGAAAPAARTARRRRACP